MPRGTLFSCTYSDKAWGHQSALPRATGRWLRDRDKGQMPCLLHLVDRVQGGAEAEFRGCAAAGLLISLSEPPHLLCSGRDGRASFTGPLRLAA